MKWLIRFPRATAGSPQPSPFWPAIYAAPLSRRASSELNPWARPSSVLLRVEMAHRRALVGTFFMAQAAVIGASPSPKNRNPLPWLPLTALAAADSVRYSRPSCSKPRGSTMT